jgi:pyruvate,water dikinase
MSRELIARGLGASPGHARGRARVIARAADLHSVRAGEVVVSEFTHPDLVLAFDRVAGIVTDHGGRLAHAALVAREMGIPAVVGTSDATDVIADGSTIVIDGTAGTVHLVAVAQAM